MSLSRLALRLVTVQALKNATLAGPRVYDSAVDPIDLQVQDRREPFAVVLTDDHTRTTEGRDLRHGNDVCDLVIEIAVAARVQASVPGDGAPQEVVVPHTDAGMEMVLDLMGHQIAEALMGGTSPYAALWRDFAMTATKIASLRGAASDNGVRYAARQIVISCNLLSDPVRGEVAAQGPWAALLALMEASAELTGLGALLRHAIEGDALLPSEAVVASILGLSPATVDFIGLTPARDSGGAAVPVSEIGTDARPFGAGE